MGQGRCDRTVRLLNHSSKGALLEHFGGAGAPHRGNRVVHALHAVLELRVGDLLRQIVGKGDLQILLAHLHAGKAELQRDIFIVDVDQVLNGLEDDVKSTADNIDAHLASAGHWDRVGIDHLEALLEDGSLTGGVGNFLLALVTVQQVLQDGVDHKAGSTFK